MVNVPVPNLVRARVLVGPLDRVPAKFVLVLSAPTLNVALEAPLLVSSPEPLSEPIVLLKPFKSSVAPVLTVNSEAGLKALGEPACNRPALTVVGPV